MDQNSSNGTDKRNWRERLGIGTKEMPRISEEFNSAPAAPKAATLTVKPAPMAPRANPKPIAAPPAARPAPASARLATPIDSEALAIKLRSQRDAAEKLAEQRVQAARQRVEAINVQPAALPAAAARPKFTFAEEEPKGQPKAAMPAPRPAEVQPQLRPSILQNQVPPSPQMNPPRPQIGGNAVPPRVPNPNYQPRPPQQQPLSPPPAAYPPAYNPNLGYRPVDPNTGYAPQPQQQAPQYNPNQGFAPPPRQPGFAPQPRLQVPQRDQQTNDYGYGQEQPRVTPRLGNTSMRPQATPQQYGEADPDDIFEQPAPRASRRATANDYQQAYREEESGYEDEGQRSRGPWILLSLLALALVVGFGSVWAYNNYVKPQGQVTQTDKVPVVKAPDAPAKVANENQTAEPQAGGTVAPSKKQIYDRIVGDREVLGGQIVPTEETPVQPVNNSQPIPAPDATVDPAAGGVGADGLPLPLPPPPGDTGQQGSLEPSGKGDQQDATIIPAAGASQAAELPLAPATTAPAAAVLPADAPIPAAPVPGEQVVATANEAISDTGADKVVEEPVKKIAIVKPQVKKVATAKIEKSLGSQPVVLVAPVKKVQAAKVVAPKAIDNNGGLYGDGAVVDETVVSQVAPPEAVVPKKRKSLTDLFRSDTQTAATDAGTVVTPVKPLAPVQKVAAAPTQIASAGGAYVAQLASFKSKAEATQEYKNLSAKHGAIITRYAPIISEAQVAGTTRYRLSIGPMASSNVAGDVCQSLFAAGERDCLVHRQ